MSGACLVVDRFHEGTGWHPLAPVPAGDVRLWDDPPTGEADVIDGHLHGWRAQVTTFDPFRSTAHLGSPMPGRRAGCLRGDQHVSPDPGCGCGVRVVRDLGTLARYWTGWAGGPVNVTRLPGRGEVVILGRVFLRVHGVGRVTGPSWDDPARDCLRVQRWELPDPTARVMLMDSSMRHLLPQLSAITSAYHLQLLTVPDLFGVSGGAA